MSAPSPSRIPVDEFEEVFDASPATAAELRRLERDLARHREMMTEVRNLTLHETKAEARALGATLAALASTEEELLVSVRATLEEMVGAATVAFTARTTN